MSRYGKTGCCWEMHSRIVYAASFCAVASSQNQATLMMKCRSCTTPAMIDKAARSGSIPKLDHPYMLQEVLMLCKKLEDSSLF